MSGAVADDPAAAILEVADGPEEGPSSLIVVGSRGLRAAARLRLGSTSTKLLHAAHWPSVSMSDPEGLNPLLGSPSPSPQGRFLPSCILFMDANQRMKELPTDNLLSMRIGAKTRSPATFAGAVRG